MLALSPVSSLCLCLEVLGSSRKSFPKYRYRNSFNDPLIISDNVNSSLGLMVISAPYPTVSVVLAFPDAVGFGASGLVDPASVTGFFFVDVDVGLYLGHDDILPMLL